MEHGADRNAATPDQRAAGKPAAARDAGWTIASNRSALWRTSPLRPVRLERLLLLLIVAGLTWRTVRYALGFPIWGDEAFVAINFLLRDFRGMIDPLIYGQIVPLGFMWADLALSRVLGVSEWALRLLPYAAGVGSLLLFWRFAGSVLKPRAAFLAIGIFAAAYYTVRHTVEVKPYATDLLISLTLTMLGWGVYRHPRSLSRWGVLTLAAGLSVWCSYPAVFVIGGVAVLLAILACEQGFRGALLVGWCLFAGVSLGSLLAMYWCYGKPHADYASTLMEIPMWARTFPPIIEFWKFPIWFCYMHLGNMFAYPIGGKAPGSLVTFALFVVGCVSLWRRERALLLLLLSPFLLSFAAAALHLYPYGGSARTTQYLTPAICLLAGQGLFATFRRFLAGPRLAVSVRLAGVVSLIIALVGIGLDLRQPYKSIHVYKSRQAVQSIVSRTQPADRWVVFNADRRVPYAPWLGDWRGTGAQFVFDALRYCPATIEWAPPPASVRREADQTIWLLAYRGAKIEFPEQQFQAYLAAMTANLGQPSLRENYPIRERRGKVESLDAYRFAAPDAPPPAGG